MEYVMEVIIKHSGDRRPPPIDAIEALPGRKRMTDAF